jgi:transcription initiation factor TFIID subunit 6
MRHGRRSVLTTADIDQALRVLNIEPLYGHIPYNPVTFRRALPFPQLQSAGSVFFVEDEEIDFDRVLREDKIALPKGVSWTAHWLAVEGVQPLIPENPPAIPRDADDSALKDSDATKVNGTGTAVNTVNGTTALPLGPTGNLPGGQKPTTQRPNQQNQPLVKQVLSRELQLYYARLTGALLPPSSDFSKRTGALASLRNDAGLQALLPYLVRWLGEGVVGVLKNGSQESSEGRVLEILLDVVAAILDNTTLFVEPYVSEDHPYHGASTYIPSSIKSFLPFSRSCFILLCLKAMQHSYGRQLLRHCLSSSHNIRQLIPLFRIVS